MASSSEPRLQSFQSDDAAMAIGQAVKIGTDREHVELGAANTDRCIGLVQNVVTAIEGIVEVALPGGGAKGKLAETIVAGNDLVSDSSGNLVKPNAEGDEIIARALEGGVSGDVIGVEVSLATAHAAQ